MKALLPPPHQHGRDGTRLAQAEEEEEVVGGGGGGGGGQPLP